MKIGGRRGGTDNERLATAWKEFMPLEDPDVDIVLFFMAIPIFSSLYNSPGSMHQV